MLVLVQAAGSTHGRLVAAALNATAAAGNMAGRGANASALSRVLTAANALTAYRREIVATGALNVMWTQYNEVRQGHGPQRPPPLPPVWCECAAIV